MREEPEAYQIGNQPFLGLTIHLDSRPLIPRPETEWWTEQLCQELTHITSKRSGLAQRGDPRTFARDEGELSSEDFLKTARRLRFLDLCAGSGAIGCAALKYLPHAEVYFSEIDPSHKPTIEKNIRENGLDASRAHIGIGDLFEPFGTTQFDVIAANPPYVPSERELPESVSDFEPALALRAGGDGLDLIRRIAEELPQHLTPNGVAWIECDSEHAEDAKALFTEQQMQTEIRTDQYDRPRLIVVSFDHG